MVGLASSREEYAAKGLTPEMIRGSYENFSKDPGMPFDLSLRSAVPATLPACREVVAAREHGGAALGEALLRQLRLQGMAHGLLIDELHTLREASHAAGIDSADLDAWAADPATEAALKADLDAARHPRGGRDPALEQARALGGRLAVHVPVARPGERRAHRGRPGVPAGPRVRHRLRERRPRSRAG